MSAITVTGLRKAYGGREVLHGISFAVEQGEVFALLGPNGAGKTTTVEILEGYRKRDDGEVRVLDVDPQRAGGAFRSRIGIVLQSSAVYPLLSVRELLNLFAGYYPAPRAADEVIALVELAEQADTRVRALSGGQLRRLDLALALIGDPELVFLDEPTTGFDPAARRHAWDTIRDLRSLGKSILLTTHYIEEAQQLADRVAILRAGEIAGIGSTQELLSSHAGVEIRYRRNGDDVVVATEEPTRVLNELTGEALAKGEELEALEVHRRTLEDVYLDLTREEDG
ncbi:MAG TPA: ABC transporter ATP-binding protein [Gaiellaceae bacterium]|nr:ABC transporter ATP-binding protein [Gaiellaceae bacterium]